jgi:bacterioferritin-associated ferredoxin
MPNLFNFSFSFSSLSLFRKKKPSIFGFDNIDDNYASIFLFALYGSSYLQLENRRRDILRACSSQYQAFNRFDDAQSYINRQSNASAIGVQNERQPNTNVQQQTNSQNNIEQPSSSIYIEPVSFLIIRFTPQPRLDERIRQDGIESLVRLFNPEIIFFAPSFSYSLHYSFDNEENAFELDDEDSDVVDDLFRNNVAPTANAPTVINANNAAVTPSSSDNQASQSSEATASLPADFKLSESTKNEIKDNKLSDPISQDELDLNEVKELVCVPVQGGTCQLYARDVFENYLNSQTAVSATFKDINTNSIVSKNAIRIVPTELVKNFVANNATPRPKQG